MKKVKLTYKKVLAVLFSLVIFAFFISVCERFVRSAILGQNVTANDGASSNLKPRTGQRIFLFRRIMRTADINLFRKKKALRLPKAKRKKRMLRLCLQSNRQ